MSSCRGHFNEVISIARGVDDCFDSLLKENVGTASTNHFDEKDIETTNTIYNPLLGQVLEQFPTLIAHQFVISHYCPPLHATYTHLT